MILLPLFLLLVLLFLFLLLIALFSTIPSFSDPFGSMHPGMVIAFLGIVFGSLWFDAPWQGHRVLRDRFLLSFPPFLLLIALASTIPPFLPPLFLLSRIPLVRCTLAWSSRS